jgi:hypothetical protein
MLFALCYSAEAQQPKKVFRIGYLSGTDRVTDAPRAEGTRRALRELGYIEGRNIIIDYRHAEGKLAGPLSLRPSWFVSKPILYSWPEGIAPSESPQMRPRLFLSS